MANLITGGSGQIGAGLAHILVARSEEVIVFDISKSTRLADIEDKIRFVRGDVGNWPEVLNVVKNNKVNRIFHMGAILTSESEANHWAAFQANIVGTYNVLEAARLLEVEKLMFTSSVGTFGPTPDDRLSDTTLQRPGSFYGVAKLYGEGLGRWYRRKFGLDFRSVRYPSVVGPGVATPGHWDAPMILSAILSKPYVCNMPSNTPTAVLYYKDAAKAADMVLQASGESIKMVNYNVGGVPAATPKEVEREIKKLIPDALITYAGVAESAARLGSKVWDDSYARSEWGWKPDYSTIEQVVSDCIRESRAYPGLYGLK